MSGGTGTGIIKFFQTRDELSFRNIRGGIWPVLLVFPLSVIIGNLRYFDHSVALAGFESHELTFFLLGFGWLVLALIPIKLIIPVLKLSAIISTILSLTLIFMPLGFQHFVVYVTCKFFNWLCAACAFYLFCFALNNVERLFGMILIQFYYGLYYITYRLIPALHWLFNPSGVLIAMVLYLGVVFFCSTKQEKINIDSDGKGSGAPFVIGLSVIHYMIMCMFNYIEWMDNNISSLAFGLGALFSIGIILLIQLLKGHSALYIWLLFLALSLLGLGALLHDAPLTFISGSFAYGLGDSLGYIIIYYMCAGAIKQSRSHRMFRFFCLVAFANYFVISGLFSLSFGYLEVPNKFLAFGVVLVLVSSCLVLMPFIQKRLFEADWTDGLYLRDMDEYSRPIKETEELNVKESLNLTPREEEVFTLLLNGIAPKEIAYTLKISYDTVNFHQKNLYRKLGIQSRAELFARFGGRA